MIFRSSLLRELAASATATFLVLLGISITTQLVRLLGQAASGQITSTGVVALLGFTLVGYLPILLSVTLFIAVLMTLTRSYRDSEMVVWFSCGQGLTQWIRPVLTFALPLVLTIATLSLLLSPWAVEKAEEFRRQMDSRDDVAQVTPGVFHESRRADRVYLVEEVPGKSNLVANVFVSSTQHGKHGVMVAQNGFQDTAENGDRFLVLQNGRRYEGEPGSPEYKIFEFERYAMRIETADAGAGADDENDVHLGVAAGAYVAESGRTVVAHRPSGQRADSLPAGHSAVVCEPPRWPFDEYRAGDSGVHDL